MPEHYWNQFWQRNLTRRRALVAGSGAALGSALLAACGRGTDQVEDGGSLLQKPVDRTKEARAGGVFRAADALDATQWDPTLQATTGAHNSRIYSRFLKKKTDYLEFGQEEIEAEIAESWEVSPDKLQVTFKLRPNAKWDSRAPTNGRTVDSSDFVFTWNHLLAFGWKIAELANSKSPSAPVLSLTATDARTVVLKLASPDAGLLTLFTSNAYLSVSPKEAESAFDIRQPPAAPVRTTFLITYRQLARF